MSAYLQRLTEYAVPCLIFCGALYCTAFLCGNRKSCGRDGESPHDADLYGAFVCAGGAGF